MAIEKTIVIKADTRAAVSSFDGLADSIVDTKNDIINLERELLKLEKQLARTNARDSKGRLRLNKTIDRTKQSIKEERLALKSLTLQKNTADKATRSQIKANRNLNKSYFESKDSLTDVNRLTAEFALKVQAVRNIFVGAVKQVRAFAKAQKLAFTAGVIGIFLIALALIVEHWEDIENFVKGTSRELQRQIDLANQLLDRTSSRLSLLQEEEKLLKKRGESTKQNIEDQKTEIANQLILNEDKLTALKIQFQTELSKATELSLLEKILGIQPKITKAEAERLTETRKFIEETELALVKAQNAQFDLANPDVKRDKVTGSGIGAQFQRDRNIENKSLEAQLEFLNKGLEIVQENEDAKFKIQTDGLVKIAEARGKARADEVIRNRLAREEEEDREQALADFKVSIAGNTLGLIGAIAKEGSELAKGIQIAQATISGIEGVQNAFTTAAASPITTFFPAYPFVQAGVAGAFSAIQIQKILSTNPSSGGGANLGGGGGGAPAAPSFNLVAGSGTNQILEGLAREQTPIRAFVVSSDQTTAAAVDRNIENEASFG